MAGNEAELLEWLPSIPLFGGLSPETLHRVIGMIGEHHLEPGEEVCKQGEAGRSMYLIREGEVVVCRSGTNGKRLKMVRMGPGEFFGEMTLIDIQKRSATVLVEEPSLLYSLSNRDLYTLYVDDVAGYVMILQNLCRELSRRLRVTNQRLQSLAETGGNAFTSTQTLIRPAVKG